MVKSVRFARPSSSSGRGLVDDAVAAYRAHDRVVCTESKPAATLALLTDWWAAWQEAEREPAQDVIVLAGRRAEVDRLNVACQQLLSARGRLRPERLQVEDLQLAVGDRVVCGRNALARLGVANGTRGTVVARAWGVTGPFWFGFVGSAVILALIWRQLAHIAHAGEEAFTARVS